MNLSAEQIQLATLIDAHVNRFPDTPLGTEQLLPTTRQAPSSASSVWRV